MEFCSLRWASCAWVWAWDWTWDCWFITSPPQNWPWSPIVGGVHPEFHIDSGTLGKRPGKMAALSGDWIEKQPSSNQMHPRRRAVFPSLGSMARDQVTTLWTAYVFNRWITCTISTSPRNQKRKWPNLESMSCSLHMVTCHVKMSSSVLSWASLKNGCCRGFQLCRTWWKWKRRCPVLRQAVSTLTRPTEWNLKSERLFHFT